MAISYKLNPQRPETTQHSRMTCHAMFATAIWQIRMPQFQDNLAEWARVVAEMRAADPSPAGRTNRSGWNSRDNAVLNHASFSDLHHEIQRLTAEVIHQMAGAHVSFVLQSWVNMHDRGGFNFLHLHDNVLLSGCFYIHTPPGAGALIFRDPRPGVITSPYKGNGPNACKDVRLAPEPGLLVLFPHWLEHYVEPHDNDAPRIALAFNALPAGPA